jgi:hypothetical protein
MKYEKFSNHKSDEVDLMATMLSAWDRYGDKGRLFDGITNFKISGKVTHFELGYIPDSAKELKEATGFLISNFVRQHIVKMPDSIESVHLDTELLRVLDERLLRAKDDTQRTFFSYYKSLIQSVSDRAAEHLSETLTASNANVGHFIRENVITFATFFKLHGDIKEEILDAMVTKDVAALLAGLRDDLKLSLLEHLDVKQRELVREEAERITAKGVRHSQTVHKQAKELVLARLLTLKGDGPLAELLAQDSDGLLVSGSSRSENAA